MMKRALATLVVGLGLTAAAALPAHASPAPPTARVIPWTQLTDLQPTTAGPFDHALAQLVVVEANGTSRFVLIVRGIDPAVAGQTFGAHLHVGPCVAGNGAAAGPHYNNGGPPSPTTEVWLDLTVNPGGVAVSTTAVPFVPTAGDRSVVIHTEATTPAGTAGARQACLSVPLA